MVFTDDDNRYGGLCTGGKQADPRGEANKTVHADCTDALKGSGVGLTLSIGPHPLEI